MSIIDIDFIWDCLKSVVDPEIGVNIVDLGLVYSVDINTIDNKKFYINIVMTFTTPTCPMAEIIMKEIKTVLMCINNCTDVLISVTFDPPWNQNMITEIGKMELGMV